MTGGMTGSATRSMTGSAARVNELYQFTSLTGVFFIYKVSEIYAVFSFKDFLVVKYAKIWVLG